MVLKFWFSFVSWLLLAFELCHGQMWGYIPEQGLIPSNWSSGYPLCGAGGQSPINIITAEAIVNSSQCTSRLDWVLESNNGTTDSFELMNDGHGIILRPIEYVIGQSGNYTRTTSNSTSIAKFKNSFNPIPSLHENYCFDSLHFHWGKKNTSLGSEHQVNGVSTPIEAHFVHFSCDFNNINDAIAYSLRNDSQDKFVLGVIGVFFNMSTSGNANFDKFLTNETLTEARSNGGISLINGFDMSTLTPIKTDYWAYEGSLTTPTCNPIVRWHVFKEQLTISEAQLDKFRQFISSVSPFPIAPNFRPIQTNSNPVYDCINPTTTTTTTTTMTTMTTMTPMTNTTTTTPMTNTTTTAPNGTTTTNASNAPSFVGKTVNVILVSILFAIFIKHV